jgi:myxalamid-type polyketide synthase MxaB
METTLMLEPTKQCSNLIEILEQWSVIQPENTAYIFLKNGEIEETKLNYAQLWEQVNAIAAQLQKAGATGERVLLFYPGGLDFITGFLGCLLASAIAVPLYPPYSNRIMSRLHSIVKDAQPKFALTHSSLLDKVEKWFIQEPSLTNLHYFAGDRLVTEQVTGCIYPHLTPDTLAFLQYTSGSTGHPKGVMVTHGNLLHNEQLVHEAFGHSKDTIFLGWLPLFHDMGLMGNILQPLYLGIPCILMSPEAFIQKPLRWLKAISDYKATTSGGPNFAYELCLEKITPEEQTALDLSSWQKAFNGAEPVRANTIESFSVMFADCGFRKEAFYPCYGMAEATLFISGPNPDSPPKIGYFEQAALGQNQGMRVPQQKNHSCTLVSCGHPWLETKIRIINPNSLSQCSEGQIGEIWIQNGSVAKGYWNQPELTNTTFRAYIGDTNEGPFLRTGDLGFILDGELFVTGRFKNLIIIRGRNYYPQDIEHTIEQSHPALKKGSVAAFSVEINEQEQLVIVAELKHHYLQHLEPDEIINAIRQKVSQKHELPVYSIAFLKTASLPKTSSGKIKHQSCRQDFLDHKLNEVYRWLNPFNSLNSSSDDQALNSKSETLSIVTEIKIGIISRLARKLGVSVAEIDSKQSFSCYGLDSLDFTQLACDFETWLGFHIAPDLLLDSPSIDAVANNLAHTVSQQ